jgi:hypothetical protein
MSIQSSRNLLEQHEIPPERVFKAVKPCSASGDSQGILRNEAGTVNTAAALSEFREVNCPAGKRLGATIVYSETFTAWWMRTLLINSDSEDSRNEPHPCIHHSAAPE